MNCPACKERMRTDKTRHKIVSDVPFVFRRLSCVCGEKVYTSEIMFDSDAERRIFVNNYLSEV